MSSLAARETAKEVLETIGKGEIPNVTKIAQKHGYSEKSAKSGLVQKRKGYKEVIIPFIEQLDKERQRVMKAMMTRDLDEVNYEKLSNVLDTLTRNMQLLGGKATENIALSIQISEAIAKKNKLDDSDTSSKQDS